MAVGIIKLNLLKEFRSGAQIVFLLPSVGSPESDIFDTARGGFHFFDLTGIAPDEFGLTEKPGVAEKQVRFDRRKVDVRMPRMGRYQAAVYNLKLIGSGKFVAVIGAYKIGQNH